MTLNKSAEETNTTEPDLGQLKAGLISFLDFYWNRAAEHTRQQIASREKAVADINRVVVQLEVFQEKMQCWSIEPTSQQIASLEKAVAVINQVVVQLEAFKKEMQ